MIRALLRIEQHPGEIHLLITDVIMPGMNGHELVQQLMKIRPHLKHLYISGCEGMRGLWSLGQTGHRSCHNAHDNAHANVYSARELWCLHERQRYLQSSKKGWTVNNNRVLLIGWDGADWKVIHRLMDAGKMPNLNRMVNEGVLGDLATLYPPYSPMLWTSIATGKHAFKHGVLGFTEVAPGGGARAVSSYSRHTKALWNIMTGEGAASVTIGWWPSHPVEPVRGVMVSNHFQRVPRGAKDAWQIPPQSVHPASLESHLKPLRWHPTDLRAEHLLNFVPLAAEVNQKQDHRLATLAKLISECSTVYGVAEATLRQVPWQFAGVYFDSIDHFSHGFMQYRPPRLPQVTDADERIYGGVVDAAYCYHDLLLGRLLRNRLRPALLAPFERLAGLRFWCSTIAAGGR